MKHARLFTSAVIFFALVLAIDVFARQSRVFANVSITRALISFALLFAPIWFFGFGAAETAKAWPGSVKIFAASALAIPYFVLAFATADFNARSALASIAFPVLLAAFLELPQLPARMTWRDAAALAIIIAGFYLKWFAAWPGALSPLFSKLFLADVAAYCFLVVRNIPGPGYSLVPAHSAFRIGFREFVFYLPIAFILGETLGFIHFNAWVPQARKAIEDVFFTFFLVALPEELFFRAIMQNLLETRLGRAGALVATSMLFGFSHFNHGPVFNWRYVLMATIAGIFYGRAWRAHRQVFASVLTHTCVDVVWSLWFR